MTSTVAGETVDKRLGRKQSRLWLGVPAALLAVSVVLAAWISLQPTKQTRVCPDGTRLMLHGITAAPPHEITLGAWWQKAFEFALPVDQRPRHVSPPPWTTLGDRPILWFTRTQLSIAAQRAMAFGQFHTMSPSPELLDERGYRMAPGFQVALNGILGQQGVGFLELRTFPRRGSLIHVRFHDGQSGIPVGDFVVPNPAPGSYPTWPPEPLPATRANGPLSISLTQLQTGIPPGKSNRPVSPGDLGYSRASFRILQSGRPTRDWEPGTLVL